MNRTHYSGELRKEHIGLEVELKGWVSKKRNLGGIIFVDIRDRSGISQLVVRPENAYYEVANELKNEYVIYAKGLLVERESKNPNMPTGDVEVDVTEVKILNKAQQPPMIIADKTDALEDTRLKYRYLDLRRPVMQNYLIQRSKITNAIREFLVNEGFLEIETPILAKSTPEGARDYLVPSRLYAGEFYALPQSPQIFKQLCMVAGLERYFQIARCFRDEDLRADRQPEFTQIDLETSFLNEEEIRDIIERLMAHTFKKILNIDLVRPFKVIAYKDAMDKYGSDKPDLRYGLELQNFKEYLNVVPFMQDKDLIKGIVVNNGANITRKKIDEYTAFVKKYKASGLAYLKYQNNELTGSIVKFLDADVQKRLVEDFKLTNDDLVLIVADSQKVTNVALGALRVFVAKQMNLADPNRYEFTWVNDWPIFEWDQDLEDYIVSTHPFTAPKPECVEYLESDHERCLANAYDLVLNGYELGSGSLRVYDQDLQQKIFDVIGLKEEEIKDRFGFFIDALKYGTPPHGGMGLGLDRIVMLMTKTDNIKDVVAFPKTQSARDLMMESPSSVDIQQLKDVHIKVEE